MTEQILEEGQQQISTWSGGETRQLFIHPQQSNLTDRNFDFRISTAIIYTEHSDFSPFNGYHRKLMLLDGALEIVHDGHYSIQLKKFEQDAFEGDWKTHSLGTGTDFNVIHNNSYQVEMMPATSDPGVDFSLEINKGEWIFIYIVRGGLKSNSTGKTIGEGGLYICREDFDSSAIDLHSLVASEWVFVKISSR